MKINKSWIGGLFMLVGASAYAGNEVGHGGSAWVCRNADQAIGWIELVDFFEAKQEYQLTLAEHPEWTVDQWEAQAVSKVNSVNASFGSQLNEALAQSNALFRKVKNAQLDLTQDIYYRVQPKKESCPSGKVQLEQIANYTDHQALLINTELWDQLDTRSQAALMIHESIYRLLRDRVQEANSLRTRGMVAHLFSTVEPKTYAEIIQLSPGSKLNFCWDVRFSGKYMMKEFSEGAVAVETGYGYGYVDRLGQWIINPTLSYSKYNYYNEFHDGLAPVVTKEAEWPDHTFQYGYIDKKGQWVIPPTLAGPPATGLLFSHGFAMAKDENKKDVMIDQTGKKVDYTFPAGVVFPSVEGYIRDFMFAEDPEKGGFGYKNRKGEWILRLGPQGSGNDLGDGLLAVYLPSTDPKLKEKDAFLMDRTGRILYGPVNGALIGFFNEGLATVWIQSKKEARVINKSGKEVFKIYLNDGYEGIRSYNSGLARAKYNGKIGFLDHEGNWAIPAKFDDGSDFSEGGAAVKVDDQWGIIDRKGNWIVPPQYEYVQPLKEGIAVFQGIHGLAGFLSVNPECLK